MQVSAESMPVPEDQCVRTDRAEEAKRRQRKHTNACARRCRRPEMGVASHVLPYFGTTGTFRQRFPSERLAAHALPCAGEALEAAVADRLGDVLGGYAIAGGEIGDRAGNAGDPVDRAC